MKTKEFMGIINRDTAKDNSLIFSVIEYSCIPFNSWFETHPRFARRKGILLHGADLWRKAYRKGRNHV